MKKNFLAERIALRYLASKKSYSAVNIISYVSIAGVALATAAMVIVLSVFNGFADFSLSKASQLDPELVVVHSKGRIIESGDSLARSLSSLKSVSAAAPILQEKAFAIADERQMPVVLRGIDPAGPMADDLKLLIIDGNGDLQIVDEFTTAIASVGVANGLRTTPYNLRQIKIYEPNRVARINPANPMGAFRSDSVLMTGVFQVERQEYDNDMMFVPLSVLRSLLNYDDEASMIEIRVEPGMSIDKAKEEIASMLPSELRVLDRLEQQQESLRMIAIEKWVTLAMLIFIMIIASFNILSTMSMLIVEKQPNHAILESMGATREMISKIYSSLSFIISVIGGLIGLLLGTAASLAQQFGGFIKFNAADMSAMAIDTYPVKVEVGDVAFVAVVIVVLGFITSRIMRLR